MIGCDFDSSLEAAIIDEQVALNAGPQPTAIQLNRHSVK